MTGDYDAPDGTDRMIFHEPLFVGVRILLAVGGAVTLLALWELLIRPGRPFHLAMLPFWFVSLGALSIGLPLLFGAIMGFERTLTLDFERRRVLDTTTAAFGLRFDRARDFAELVDFVVTESSWSDGPPNWVVGARFSTGDRPWSIRSLASEGAARALIDEIRARMHRPRA